MKTRKTDSLGFRLTIWYSLVMGALFLIVGIFMYRSLREDEFRAMHFTAYTIAAETCGFWEETRGTDWSDAIQFAEERYYSLQPMIKVVQVFRRNEFRIVELARSLNVNESFPNLADGLYRALYNTPEDHVDQTFEKGFSDGYPRHIVLFKSKHGGYFIQVAISMKPMLMKMRRVAILLIFGGIILLFFTFLGSSLIIRKAIAPVNNVMSAARKISADDLAMRIDRGPRRDEIGALVDTFNEMIARLETSVARIKQFSGDVSHELRTPLTVIRGEVEVSLRKRRKIAEYIRSMQAILSQTEQMSRIIDDLLFLSRIDTLKKTGKRDEIDLADMATEVSEGFRELAENKDIQFKTGPFPPVSVQGNRSLMERMAANLIDNAIRYTSSGGKIEVTLQSLESRAVFSIIDTGIGIPIDSIQNIFDRFYVADPSRSKQCGGVGLGLAIVKSIADFHGADIEVESMEGEGSTFRVIFPLPAHESITRVIHQEAWDDRL